MTLAGQTFLFNADRQVTTGAKLDKFRLLMMNELVFFPGSGMLLQGSIHLKHERSQIALSTLLAPSFFSGHMNTTVYVDIDELLVW